MRISMGALSKRAIQSLLRDPSSGVGVALASYKDQIAEIATKALAVLKHPYDDRGEVARILRDELGAIDEAECQCASAQEINRLAAWLIENTEEPSHNEGAVSCAIRLIQDNLDIAAKYGKGKD